uniref:RPA-interacting protein C-terminal domain-containing protein n=1 Tax=Oryzias sinensis TaxID=183150 RepID=A0A8C8A0Z6_9TELE
MCRVWTWMSCVNMDVVCEHGCVTCEHGCTVSSDVFLLSPEKSLVEEYERNLQFELQYISSVVEGREEVQIICPVCGMNNLSSSSACISCQCGLYISTQKHSITLEGLQHLLEVRVSEHMEECLYTPVFSVTADSEASSNLMISCQVCDYLSVVL